jgi:hypothetical protein
MARLNPSSWPGESPQDRSLNKRKAAPEKGNCRAPPDRSSRFLPRRLHKQVARDAGRVRGRRHLGHIRSARYDPHRGRRQNNCLDRCQRSRLESLPFPDDQDCPPGRESVPYRYAHIDHRFLGGKGRTLWIQRIVRRATRYEKPERRRTNLPARGAQQRMLPLVLRSGPRPRPRWPEFAIATNDRSYSLLPANFDRARSRLSRAVASPGSMRSAD